MTELILPRKRWDEERDEVLFPNSTVFSHYHTYYRHDPVVTDLCWILGFKMRNGFLPEEHPYWFQGETDKTYRPDKGVCPAYEVWNFGDTKN